MPCQHLHQSCVDTFVRQFGDKLSPPTVTASTIDARQPVNAFKQIYDCLRSKTATLNLCI